MIWLSRLDAADGRWPDGALSTLRTKTAQGNQKCNAPHPGMRSGAGRVHLIRLWPDRQLSERPRLPWRGRWIGVD
jgi:hypothetical protein